MCGSKKCRGKDRWRCTHTKKTKGAHPKRVENICMEEKVTLPKVLPCPSAPLLMHASTHVVLIYFVIGWPAHVAKGFGDILTQRHDAHL